MTDRTETTRDCGCPPHRCIAEEMNDIHQNSVSVCPRSSVASPPTHPTNPPIGTLVIVSAHTAATVIRYDEKTGWPVVRLWEREVIVKPELLEVYQEQPLEGTPEP